MIHKANINISIDIQTVEKISLGTHWPHPLWVITPSRISGLTPDLAKGRHWKENSSPSLYPLFCLLQEPKFGGDFEGVLHCTVATGQGLADTGSWKFLFSLHRRAGEARQVAFFTAWRAVGSSSKQAPVNVSPLWVYMGRS